MIEQFGVIVSLIDVPFFDSSLTSRTVNSLSNGPNKHLLLDIQTSTALRNRILPLKHHSQGRKYDWPNRVTNKPPPPS